MFLLVWPIVAKTPLAERIAPVGGIVLFAYGYVVNTPLWDFGRLLGIYVVFFFLVAQVISWAVFDQAPSVRMLVGGAFVVVGGVIMSVW